MIVPVLLVLAVVFLVLGFLHVIGLIVGIGLAVACVVALLVLGIVQGGTGRVRRW